MSVPLFCSFLAPLSLAGFVEFLYQISVCCGAYLPLGVEKAPKPAGPAWKCCAVGVAAVLPTSVRSIAYMTGPGVGGAGQYFPSKVSKHKDLLNSRKSELGFSIEFASFGASSLTGHVD